MEKKDIEHLAKLARIELAEHEINSLAGDITDILGYVSAVSEITGDTGTEKRVGATYNVFREDERTNESDEYTEAMLNEAPEREGRYVKVKKILGENDS